MGFSLSPDWSGALAGREVLGRIDRVAARVSDARAEGQVIAPGDADVFRALNLTPPDRVRVVILGQDPYPTAGHADGLCFSVRPGIAVPRSLRNIYREMSDDLGLVEAGHGSLVFWAEQGVLLLNSVLTVQVGEANSHAGWGWQEITDAMIAAVSDQPKPVVFMLWGRHAQQKSLLIDRKKHLILESAHPSPLSARRGFFGSRPFSKANSWLSAQGRDPVDWRLPTQA